MKSRGWLLQTMTEIRQEFPNKKIFWLGESLGSNYAIRMAAKHPELVDGLILSAPTIRRHHSAPVKLMTDVCVNTCLRQTSNCHWKLMPVDTWRMILRLFRLFWLIRWCASRLVHMIIIRRKSDQNTLPYADEIKNNLPILVIQGTLADGYRRLQQRDDGP